MAVTKKIKCVILGGGGHAKVVIDCLEGHEEIVPHAVLDADAALWGKELLGVPVRGNDDQLEILKQEGVTHFISGIGGVKNNEPRRRIFDFGLANGLVPLTVCHPSAILSRWATIGRGTLIGAGCIINPRVTVGEDCIINTGAVIDHDCHIGDHVHIATGATLSGTVRIESLVHIGTGVSIRHGICIGEAAVVGAGSVVVNDVSPHTTVKGVPAK